MHMDSVDDHPEVFQVAASHVLMLMSLYLLTPGRMHNCTFLCM